MSFTRLLPKSDVEIYQFPGLLSSEECATLIGCIDAALQPSTVTLGPSNYRTSRTCHLGTSAPALSAALDQRLADVLGLDPACAEPIQGQRYDRGQYFKPHTDWFAPGTEEFEQHARCGGQRTWSLMVYLNAVLAGGATSFPLLNLSITPMPGWGLAWNNLRPDGSPHPDTLHEALPVLDGRKYVITKWFRAMPGRV